MVHCSFSVSDTHLALWKLILISPSVSRLFLNPTRNSLITSNTNHRRAKKESLEMKRKPQYK
jgi:hypothetical protein